MTAKRMPPAFAPGLIFQRIRDGLNFVLPRGAPPEEIAERRKTPAQRELEQAQAAAQEKLARYRQEFNTRVSEFAGQIARGEIAPIVFRAKMRIEIHFLMLTAATIGVGGTANMTPAILARVDEQVRVQMAYLDNWIAQIERTPVENRSAGQMETRARMYGGTGNTIMHEMVDRVVFGDFPNLPFQPGEESECRSNCKCRWEWASVDREKGNADVYWRLAPAEHCETCVRRAGAFNPLRIRNWQFENMPADMGGLRRKT